MGIFSGLLGHAAEANLEKVEQQLERFLIEGETIEKAYQLIRDLMVLTNKRVILIDKQGITGRKTEYLSIPYRSIIKYSIESTGHFDLDAELSLWLTSHQEPMKMEFKKSKDVAAIYNILTQYTCR
jgi:hypothetical protein